MSDKLLLECPNCKNKIQINIFLCKEGTEIFCPTCNKLIKLHFEGDTPKQILDKIKRDIEKELKKINKKIVLRF